MSPNAETPIVTSHTSQNQPLILFPSIALHDALDNLAALMQCLLDIQQENYGVHLLHRMIHDTLRYLSQVAAQGHPPNA
jgi:hypothetical protein